jgi:hypothetical protein
MSRDPAVFHAYEGCGVSAQHRRTHALRGAVKVFHFLSGYICQVVKQGCVAAFERLQRDGFLVRGAPLPTPLEEAEPLERYSPYGGLVCLACRSTLLSRMALVQSTPKGGALCHVNGLLQ